MLTFIGIFCGVSFVGKILIQYYLDIFAATENGEKRHLFSRVRVFLPYYYEVPPRKNFLKRFCNILLYLFIISAILYVLIWNLK